MDVVLEGIQIHYLAAVCFLGIAITRPVHAQHATEWSGGQIINLWGLPGSTNSGASAINDAGQVVGYSSVLAGTTYATEWSGDSVINLGEGAATAINDAGQVVGGSNTPEPSTWAIMLLGFAGLGYAGHRRVKAA